LVVAIFCLGIWLFHGTLLRGMAQLLVKSDPLPEEPYAVMVWDIPYSSDNFNEIKLVCNEKNLCILFYKKETRLMRLGLEKKWCETEKIELNKRNIENFLIFKTTKGIFLYLFCKQIADFLDNNTDKKIVLFHEKTKGASIYYILKRHLKHDNLKRIHFYPLDDPEFDFNQWYLKKEGQAAIIQSFGGLLFDFFVGDGQLPGPDWDEKAYEESLP